MTTSIQYRWRSALIWLSAVSVQLMFSNACSRSPYKILDVPLSTPPDVQHDSARWADAQEALPFDSIALTRTDECDLARCPSYTIVVSRNGDARYVGLVAAEHIGLWTGHVDFVEYARLCQFIENARVMNVMADSSTVFISHGSKYEVRLWSAGRGEPFRKRGWEFEGPAEGWILRTLMDGIASHIDWERS